ncbi:MAG: hypothetical protein JWM27_1717 [Gemmatimonadetes bacterium]|nr:hypothetical protein [Gemmatimonadota bacterium]
MSDGVTSVGNGEAKGAAGDADEFLRHRPLLFGIAYRMLGSAADAEDAVQDTWLRWRGAGEEARSPRAFLAATVTRLCIDQLRSARVRREEYVGAWLPEPLVGDVDLGSEARPLREESLATAFLLMLERLSPVERAVFLLREVFEFDYGEIAGVVGKAEASCRQVLHRARGRMAAARPTAPAAAPAQALALELARRFVHACGTGDLQGLLGLLADDVVAWGDGGGFASSALRPVLGADRVSRLMLGLSGKIGAAGMELRFATVNGAPGIVVYDGEKADSVTSFELREGRIAAIYSVRNPHKLTRVPRRSELRGA